MTLVSLLTVAEEKALCIPHRVHDARREDVTVDDGRGGYRSLHADESRGHVLVSFDSKDMRRAGLTAIGTTAYCDGLR